MPKKQIKETLMMCHRGPAKVITFGYDTQVVGLDVIKVIGIDKEFTITHRKSGLSLGVYFTAYTRAIKFANKYLKGFDFLQDSKTLQANKELPACLRATKTKEGL